MYVYIEWLRTAFDNMLKYHYYDRIHVHIETCIAIVGLTRVFSHNVKMAAAHPSLWDRFWGVRCSCVECLIYCSRLPVTIQVSSSIFYCFRNYEPPSDGISHNFFENTVLNMLSRISVLSTLHSYLAGVGVQGLRLVILAVLDAVDKLLDTCTSIHDFKKVLYMKFGL